MSVGDIDVEMTRKCRSFEGCTTVLFVVFSLHAKKLYCHVISLHIALSCDFTARMEIVLSCYFHCIKTGHFWFGPVCKIFYRKFLYLSVPQYNLFLPAFFTEKYQTRDNNKQQLAALVVAIVHVISAAMIESFDLLAND